MRAWLLIIFFMLLGGCSHFETGRTFLTEMERDDSHFFNPSDDFPVVAGDSGEFGLSEEERRARTPASFEDLATRRHHRALLAELRDLESTLSEESAELYERHKHQFGNVSEKIYFLKLPSRERRDYLESRGFLIETKRSIASVEQEKPFNRRSQEVALGMTKDDILSTLGRPYRVEIAGNPANQNERWLYQMNGASKYIYFESGLVGGWE